MTIYLVRLNRHDELNESRPCIHCCAVLREFGIKKVVYTTDTHYESVKLIHYIPRRNTMGYNYIKVLLGIEPRLHDSKS